MKHLWPSIQRSHLTFRASLRGWRVKTQISRSDKILQLHLTSLSPVHPGSHISPLLQTRWEAEELDRIDRNIWRWITHFVVWEKSAPILFRCRQCHHRLQLNYKKQEMTEQHFAITEQHFTRVPAASLLLSTLMLRQNTSSRSRLSRHISDRGNMLSWGVSIIVY